MRISGRLPPVLRRSLAGAWLDLQSLPGRLREPSRWNEPWQVVHNVGGGDFDRTGQALLSQLRTYAGLTAQSSVLDIGCGTGRLAWPLSNFLSPNTPYIGFDVSARAIQASRRRVGRAHANFAFVRADIRNREYNPKGAVAESAFAFPAAAASIEVAAAFSVFSHMGLPSIVHYLTEAERVLRRGGRFAFTAYALTLARVQALDDGEGARSFQPWSDGSRVTDPRSPERAIAHPLTRLQAAVKQAGLELPDGWRFGGWLGPADYDGAQDLFVAVKP